MNGFVEFLGWFGAVTVLLGYLLFSTGRLPNGPVYQLFNLVGGLSVAINVAAHHAVPSTIVNGIWALVAMVVLVRTGRARRAARRGLRAASGRPAHDPVAHVEPPTTTAVLPVIGPALRAHDDATTAPAGPTATTGPTPPTDGGTAGTRATTPAGSTAPTTGSIPLVDSVPVITAAIALALVHAAQDRTDDDRTNDDRSHDDRSHDDRSRDDRSHDDRTHHDRTDDDRPHHGGHEADGTAADARERASADTEHRTPTVIEHRTPTATEHRTSAS